MANDTYAPYQRPRRAPLHLDPASFERKSVDGSQSSSSSPTSTTVSPVTPLGREDSVPLTPSEVDFDATREPVSGPQRTSSKGKADKDGEKEKRKRSRVTPEQLVHLERFFSVDRSPTAVRRKEISELLGMQERQTQIWFQNRYIQLKSVLDPPSNNITDERKQSCTMAKSIAAIASNRLPTLLLS